MIPPGQARWGCDLCMSVVGWDKPASGAGPPCSTLDSPSVRHPPRNAMYSAIDRRIDHIATSLPILVSRLEALGYEFAHPCATLPGPEPNVEASIQRIETE